MQAVDTKNMVHGQRFVDAEWNARVPPVPRPRPERSERSGNASAGVGAGIASSLAGSAFIALALAAIGGGGEVWFVLVFAVMFSMIPAMLLGVLLGHFGVPWLAPLIGPLAALLLFLPDGTLGRLIWLGAGVVSGLTFLLLEPRLVPLTSPKLFIPANPPGRQPIGPVPPPPSGPDQAT